MAKKKQKTGFSKNLMATLIFFLAGYIAFNHFESMWLYLAGVLFIASGLYGITCLTATRKFIFS